MRPSLAMVVLLAGCAPAASSADRSGHDESPRPAPSLSYAGPAYFPPTLGEANIGCASWPGRSLPILSDFARGWYSTVLRAAAEPSLYLASRAARPAAYATIRFTLLRSFHPPVVIRVETSSAGRRRLVAKQLSGAGGYDPGHIDGTIDRPLTADEIARLQETITRLRPFDLPPDPCGIGMDGAQWLFESADAGGYHFVSRWSPQNGPANEFGRFLMDLTGWEFGEVY